MILEYGRAATIFGIVQEGVLGVVFGFGLSQNVVLEIFVVVSNVVGALSVVEELPVVASVGGGADRPASMHSFWRSNILLHTANASLFSNL